MAGGAGVGVGVGLAAVGLYNATQLPSTGDGGGGFNTANIAFIAAGGALLLLGGTAVAVDLGNE